MSHIYENSDAVKSDFPQERKIAFKGLEKCLEAFTCGEGRVVRRYARLLKQLSGTQDDDDDAISWSSSDEDNPGGAGGSNHNHNTTISRQSGIARKLNSQIDFETRIRSKEHGRRLTRARFSRSVASLSQTLTTNNTSCSSQPIPEESCPSILDQSFLNETSQISFSKISDTAEAEVPLSLTPKIDRNTVSPVFKAKPKRTASRGRIKRNMSRGSKGTVDCCTEKRDEMESLHINFLGDCNANEKGLTSPEVKKINADENAENMITSPVLESRVSRRSQNKGLSSCDADVISASPIVRKSVRIRRMAGRRTQPVSPVFKPNTKNVAFKRHRRKTAVKTSQSRTATSTNPVINEKPLLIDEIDIPSTIDSAKNFVKRSLNFDLKCDGNGDGIDNANSVEEVSVSSENPVIIESDSLRSDTPIINTVSEGVQQHLGTESGSIIKCTTKPPAGRRLSLNETKVIDEVCTEELQPSKRRNLNKCTSTSPADRRSSLNETNMIDEVCTEELQLAKYPKPLVGRRKKSLSLQKICPASSNKRKCSDDSPPSQDIIEENSETQAFVKPRISNKNVKRAHSETINPNATVFIDEDSETQNVCVPESVVDNTEREVNLARNPNATSLIDEDSQSQNIRNVPLQPPENEDERNEQNEVFVPPPDKVEMETEVAEAQSKLAVKSLQQAYAELHNEFGKSLHSEKACLSKPSFTLKATDQELIISQSSIRSGNNPPCSRTSPEIESVSSQASRQDQQVHRPSVGTISKSSSNKMSPVVHSPMVISSVGSSPEVRGRADFPFVVVEDEHNAPPKKRNKKLDPNGIAARLQRLLNQRQSAARIWQFKRSRLNRLNEKDEGPNEEYPRGRILTVRSVYVEYSHVVLSTIENQVSGELDVGKEFKSSVLVVLDPKVAFRLGKIMTASSIEIFPPWQAMDLTDRDTTVILGANIVQVLSTDPTLKTAPESIEKLSTVTKYTCQCLPPLPDAVVLDCWDGAQSLGLLDILFPRQAPACSQLLHCDDSIWQGLSSTKDDPFKQHYYSVQEMLSTHGTVSHGKGHLVLTVLRVLCFRQKSGDNSSKKECTPHWSIIGEDDLKEVCEVVLGAMSSEVSERPDVSDFLTGKALGRKYKFRGLAVSQRLDRLRYCGAWTVIPKGQKHFYVLVPSNQFSLTVENSTLHRS